VERWPEWQETADCGCVEGISRVDACVAAGKQLTGGLRHRKQLTDGLCDRTPLNWKPMCRCARRTWRESHSPWTTRSRSCVPRTIKSNKCSFLTLLVQILSLKRDMFCSECNTNIIFLFFWWGGGVALRIRISEFPTGCRFLQGLLKLNVP
jgi:hypothetical protein